MLIWENLNVSPMVMQLGMICKCQTRNLSMETHTQVFNFKMVMGEFSLWMN